MGNGRWIRPIAFVAVLVVAIGGLTVMFRGGKGERLTVTAHFAKAVGLYPGSSVRVLGVKVGHIRSIRPAGDAVTVVLDLPADTPFPADARAVIIPPSLVSDRYVELSPVYDGGARLADGADIGLDHTMTPVELDEILGSLDTFLVALGPEGANSEGALSRLIDTGARDLGKGGGKALHDTLTNLAAAVKTLSDSRGDLTGVISNLATFTDTLARNDSQIRTLTRDLAAGSQFLAGESDALEESLKNLATALGEIGSLVRDHRSELSADVQTLAKVAAVVVKNKKSLTEALDVLPLGTANLAGTVNTERHTLDIRNDNHQTSDPYSILVCQLLAPILGVACPPGPAVPGAAATRKQPSPRQAAADTVTRRMSLAGMFGGAS